jgi:hypothetical protein
MLPDHSGDPIAEEEAASWVGYYDNFIDKSEDPFAPISNFWYPIVNETDRVYVAGAEGYDYNTTSSQVVGVLVAEFYWRSMFR